MEADDIVQDMALEASQSDESAEDADDLGDGKIMVIAVSRE